MYVCLCVCLFPIDLYTNNNNYNDNNDNNLPHVWSSFPSTTIPAGPVDIRRTVQYHQAHGVRPHLTPGREQGRRGRIYDAHAAPILDRAVGLY